MDAKVKFERHLFLRSKELLEWSCSRNSSLHPFHLRDLFQRRIHYMSADIYTRLDTNFGFFYVPFQDLKLALRYICLFQYLVHKLTLTHYNCENFDSLCWYSTNSIRSVLDCSHLWAHALQKYWPKITLAAGSTAKIVFAYSKFHRPDRVAFSRLWHSALSK